jgi:phytanoyl-CoA hydroxylase
MRVLEAKQADFYRQEGYVLAAGAVPEEALGLMQGILGDWCQRQVDEWVGRGLLEDGLEGLDFSCRLARAWQAAGRPSYMRSPRRDLVGAEMYALLAHPALLDLAGDLLGTDEISVHGIFNARPKLPDQRWTDTPWHQDAQYYRDAAEIHVLSLWLPLQDVDERNSCLQVAPCRHGDGLYADYHDEETGFKGISQEERDGLPRVSMPMRRGDALCFTQRTPHRALANRSDAVRWSMDLRYEATDTATASGRQYGFIARSPSAPSQILSCGEWLDKWDGVPAGTY